MSAPPTGVLFNEPRAKPLNTIGGIQPGAYYQFYLTGTTTPAIVYADGLLSTPLSQTPGTGGTTAASDGRLVPIYMSPSVTYRVQLYSSTAILLEDTDPYIPGPSAGQIGAALYPVQTVETASSVVPANLQYPPLDPRRYSTIANWSAVYGNVSNPTDTDWPFYRGDHAQHPTQTNAIVGYKTFDDSLLGGTIGWHCTALGAQALQFNGGSTLAGGTNTAIGFASQQHGIDTSGNTSVGPETLGLITGVSSAHNNAFGYRCGALMTTGTQNNFFGFTVATNMTAGQNNHGFGESVYENMIMGEGNHNFGYQAKFASVAGNYSHSFGYQTLFSESAAVITAITKAASAIVTVSTVSGTNPFVVGSPITIEGVVGMTQINGLLGLVTAIGGASGAWTITVGINSSAFTTYTSGGYLAPAGNSCFGYRTGTAIATNGGNTVMGHGAGSINPLDINNSIYGYEAGKNLSTSANYNVVMGFQAAVNSLAMNNMVVIGQQAGTAIAASTQSVVIGANAANQLAAASNNTIVGATAAINLNGNNNTAVGFNTGSQGSLQTYTNTGSFGANAVPTGSNQITLGDTNITTIRAQVTTITAISDERFKKNIEPLTFLPEGFLDEVQIVAFEWLAEDMQHHGRQVGVIAQQLDTIQEKYGLQWMKLVDKSNPDQWEATPGKLLFPLIQRVQKQEARLKALEAKLEIQN